MSPKGKKGEEVLKAGPFCHQITGSATSRLEACLQQIVDSTDSASSPSVQRSVEIPTLKEAADALNDLPEFKDDSDLWAQAFNILGGPRQRALFMACPDQMKRGRKFTKTSDYVDPVDYYDYDIYDEDPYNNDEFGDPSNVNEYGEGSSHPIPRHNFGWRRPAAEAILHIHNQTYMAKEPCRTSAFKGAKWIAELNLGHPKRMYQAFCMSKTNFLALCQLLESRYGLQEAERISVQVAIFLWIVGQRANNRSAQERFQRSGETISRCFHHVLDALN
ncbi:hypothetical protein Vadar_002792 [Vaccinium darrowii]|uniref:Uncharacterized protein n=1 Tax=Vaccinium darrowii TaxID=229202 RepID=A0ACB7Z983_9ERIC|nr:hypothetical protein Vadar_002792 [Vaccinium darrowii]